MITADLGVADQNTTHSARPASFRFASEAEDPAVLADIYRKDVNIAVWQRELSSELREAAHSFATSNPLFRSGLTVSPASALSTVTESLRSSDQCGVSRSITELVEMFCYLLDLRRAGMRISVLDAAMCPRFHVDMVPCRLVTTYIGVATEWLHHDAVNRSKLGPGSGSQPDLESGLLKDPSEIQQMNCGDVALLKGELWEGNADAGLVHRSPSVEAGEARLLVTLDVSR